MKYKKDNMELIIIQDDDIDTPRNWDNQTTMVCFHNKHSLGDKTDYKIDDYNSFYELETNIRNKNDIELIIPISLYDHSGLSISTGISQNWDSGQIGFIFITKKTMKENNLTIEDARKIIVQEIETYNQYLSGDIWQYVLIEKEICECCSHMNKEEIDGCGGFYGNDFKENGLFDTISLRKFNIDEWQEVDE